MYRGILNFKSESQQQCRDHETLKYILARSFPVQGLMSILNSFSKITHSAIFLQSISRADTKS